MYKLAVQCSDVILYNGLDMEADLFEVYFFVLIFIYPNFLAIKKDAVKQNNIFSAFDSLGQNQFRISSLLDIIDRWFLVLQNAWFLKRLLFHYHKIVYCSISTLIKRTPLDVEHKQRGLNKMYKSGDNTALNVRCSQHQALNTESFLKSGRKLKPEQLVLPLER